MEITVDNVVEFLESNKESVEVQALLETYAPKSEGGEVTPEKLQTILATEEGKKVIQPELDRYASKAIDSWKNNNLSKIIDEEMIKRQVVETPEQKALREMQDRIARIEREKEQATMKTVVLQEFNKRGLPENLSSFMIGETEEQTRRNINMLDMEFRSALEKAVEDRLKGTSSAPKISSTNEGGGVAKKALKDMTMDEMMALQAENPEYFEMLTRNV